MEHHGRRRGVIRALCLRKKDPKNTVVGTRRNANRAPTEPF